MLSTGTDRELGPGRSRCHTRSLAAGVPPAAWGPRLWGRSWAFRAAPLHPQGLCTPLLGAPHIAPPVGSRAQASPPPRRNQQALISICTAWYRRPWTPGRQRLPEAGEVSGRSTTFSCKVGVSGWF